LGIFFVVTYRTEYHREWCSHSEACQALGWMNAICRPRRGETGRAHCIKTPDRRRQWQQENKPERNATSPVGSMRPDQSHQFTPALTGTKYESYSNGSLPSLIPSGVGFWRGCIGLAWTQRITAGAGQQTRRFCQS
jgi:hypothetical protein